MQNDGRYICFTLGKEKFALPLLQVKEVIGVIATTPIPQAPDYYKGIINLRGKIISIIDLKSRLAVNSQTMETTIIILDFEERSLGFVVDSVDCVSAFSAEDIQTTDGHDTQIMSQLLGVARKDQNLTLLLNLEAVLHGEETLSYEEARFEAA